MSETLGSLCDKLTIIKLKQWHTVEALKLNSLSFQENQIQQEIDEFISLAVSGEIPKTKLTFASNKVYPNDNHVIKQSHQRMGLLFSELAEINCKLWHEQERVYEFEQVPDNEKIFVIKQLAVLNLERNRCIEKIDNLFLKLL